MRNVIELVRVAAWPVVALVVLYTLSRPHLRDPIQQLIRRVSRFKGAGFEIELKPEEAREVKQTLELTFGVFRARVKEEFDRQVHAERVDDLLEMVVQDEIVPALAIPGCDFRVTIYVPDILFHGVLYRLLPPRGRPREDVFAAVRDHRESLAPAKAARGNGLGRSNRIDRTMGHDPRRGYAEWPQHQVVRLRHSRRR
jgi:hypothetical protein